MRRNAINIGCLLFGIALFLTMVECFEPSSSGRVSIPLNLTSKVQDRIAENTPDGIFTDLQFDEFKLVKHLSVTYGLDYRLILAIMKQESQFNYTALSERGAMGLMQLMPVTNAEVLDRLNLEHNYLPKSNIRAGIYYFASLMDLFSKYAPIDQLSLALAAYNAGPMRIYDAQELAAYMGDNPGRWETIQNILPLLSKRYYTLHESVWPQGHPRSGFFGSWKQTVQYVDNVLSNYQYYKTALR